MAVRDEDKNLAVYRICVDTIERCDKGRKRLLELPPLARRKLHLEIVGMCQEDK